MNDYNKGFFFGFIICFFIFTLTAASNNNNKKNDEIINKLNQLEEKMDFNYNVINKHLVRLMAYGVKVKEGYIDGIRQPISCK